MINPVYHVPTHGIGHQNGAVSYARARLPATAGCATPLGSIGRRHHLAGSAEVIAEKGPRDYFSAKVPGGAAAPGSASGLPGYCAGTCGEFP